MLKDGCFCCVINSSCCCCKVDTGKVANGVSPQPLPSPLAMGGGVSVPATRPANAEQSWAPPPATGCWLFPIAAGVANTARQASDRSLSPLPIHPKSRCLLSRRFFCPPPIPFHSSVLLSPAPFPLLMHLLSWLVAVETPRGCSHLSSDLSRFLALCFFSVVFSSPFHPSSCCFNAKIQFPYFGSKSPVGRRSGSLLAPCGITAAMPGTRNWRVTQCTRT